MICQEVARQIREIQIHTRRLISGTLIGDVSSAQKGSGFEFDQIREYQQGDDVRFIDWKSSARMNKILVKQYIEERSRTVVLAVDVSGSTFFSSHDELKTNVMSQVAAVLALVAEFGHDRVALLLFSDIIELFIPPGKTKHHIHAVMQSLFSFKPQRSGTDINVALDYVARLKRKDMITFLISDFSRADFSKQLSIVTKKCELVAVRCLDQTEYQLPLIGLLTVQDPETGTIHTIKGSGAVNDFLKKRIIEQNNVFRQYGIDHIEVTPGKPFMGDLIRFFRKRMRY